MSEFAYFRDIALELLHDKLSPAVDDVCGGVNDTAEVQQQLASRCERLVGRVTRAIAKTEDELSSEWSALRDEVATNRRVAATAATAATAAASVNVPAHHLLSRTAQYDLEAIPAKLIDIADLKYKLLQCTTSARNHTLIPVFGARQAVTKHDADFFTRCAAALATALGVLLSVGGTSSAAMEAFSNGATSDGEIVDIGATTLTSLLRESLQIVCCRQPTAAASSATAPAPQPSQAAASTVAPAVSPPSATAAPAANVPPPPTKAGFWDFTKNAPPPPPPGSPPRLPPYDPSMSAAAVADVLSHFYSYHAPQYVESVPYLLQQHQGNFAALFALVASKYGGGGNGEDNANTATQATSATLPTPPAQPAHPAVAVAVAASSAGAPQVAAASNVAVAASSPVDPAAAGGCVVQ